MKIHPSWTISGKATLGVFCLPVVAAGFGGYHGGIELSLFAYVAALLLGSLLYTLFAWIFRWPRLNWAAIKEFCSSFSTTIS